MLESWVLLVAFSWLRVWGSGFRVTGLGFEVLGLGPRVLGLGLRVQGIWSPCSTGPILLDLQ